jgi:hypothetical protein
MHSTPQVAEKEKKLRNGYYSKELSFDEAPPLI